MTISVVCARAGCDVICPPDTVWIGHGRFYCSEGCIRKANGTELR